MLGYFGGGNQAWLLGIQAYKVGCPKGSIEFFLEHSLVVHVVASCFLQKVEISARLMGSYMYADETYLYPTKDKG